VSLDVTYMMLCGRSFRRRKLQGRQWKQTALAPTEHFAPGEIRCHIGVADDSALYQRTRPNVPGYLNFLLAPYCISIDLPSNILLHLLLLNFCTHACTHAHCQQINSVGLWAYSIWRPDRTTGGYLSYSYMRRCYVT